MHVDEFLSPLFPALLLLLGVALQLAYGGALLLAREFALSGASGKWLRVAALLGGCGALAAAWLRSDAVFLVGQLIVCCALLTRPELGMDGAATKGERRG